MIIRVRVLVCWSVHNEAQDESAKQQRVLGSGRARPAPRRKGRTQNRAHARNADLYLEERQTRRRETVSEGGDVVEIETQSTATEVRRVGG